MIQQGPLKLLFSFLGPKDSFRLDGKESACNAGDQGSIPGSGRSPGEGNGTHFSILAWTIPWREKKVRVSPPASLKPLLNISNAPDPIKGAKLSKPQPLLSGMDKQIPAKGSAGVEVLG